MNKRFLLPLACVLAFCFVSVKVSDAIVPLGYILSAFLIDDTLSMGIRFLLLAPFMGSLSSAFVEHTLARSLLLGISIVGMLGLWVFCLVAFVIFPMATGISYALYIVPFITSIPFIWAMMATATYSVRSILSLYGDKTLHLI